tara:strand:- start:52 stop:501 length:450 start_codon:yes stop_codon:yes gene_type:complete
MKIIITFVSLFLLVVTAKSQTTLSAIVVDGQQYDITYRTGVSFDDYQTTIDDAPWWNLNASNPSPSQFATSVYNSNNALNTVRFAYSEQTFGGTDYALYFDQANGSTNAASNANGTYAVSAVAVPAPLPILGILPVVGFLKRMRKRQRA